MPSITIYPVLSDELPLVYDSTVKQVRQRDPQAKLVEIRAETRKAKGEDISTLRLFFYSPLDDVLVQYDCRFYAGLERGSLVVEKPMLQPSPWFAGDFDLAAPSYINDPRDPQPNFPNSPALRLPAETTWRPALEKTWELAGKPDTYHVSLMFSSRAPYDVMVSFSKDNSVGSELGRLVSHLDRYYFAPTLWCPIPGQVLPDRTASCRQK